MKRNSPKRREAKRKQLTESLHGVVDHMNNITPIEACIKILAEALIFILEEQCPRKH